MLLAQRTGAGVGGVEGGAYSSLNPTALYSHSLWVSYSSGLSPQIALILLTLIPEGQNQTTYCVLFPHKPLTAWHITYENYLRFLRSLVSGVF